MTEAEAKTTRRKEREKQRKGDAKTGKCGKITEEIMQGGGTLDDT